MRPQVEIQNMKNANLRDVVAIIELAATLEDGILKGEEWDELKVAHVLKDLRKQQKHFKGLSFGTISAYGENGAIIHYKPTKATSKKIGKDSLLLLDSGLKKYTCVFIITQFSNSSYQNIPNTQFSKYAIYSKGGQYLDGTTDTTRTFHYGTPTEFEREAYTRVLMGVIDLARATFISDHGTTDSRLDILAR